VAEQNSGDMSILRLRVCGRQRGLSCKTVTRCAVIEVEARASGQHRATSSRLEA
jgi:hypothetical protein